ncbi:MAG: hypothetical protein A2735_01660 [Candidatus Yanofskybacteria bacterium RIFCSPHIGHO2_01_FULL_41_21]|uniref:Schlafen AlbA-2 domain-containing protein n=1 Tax=Candidatus Yanofskybacteria bacterium RIFCSPHIGHO2_01_FULL_41_21 TaxID=1802660 RepID=A0A1F8E9W5_9BACT|nr:MAG: hypothetical protein A2735_01660 [Candidatus Yanofskybacteria bacterium RIFCSPHIGHO2_01_FULL_41_21]
MLQDLKKKKSVVVIRNLVIAEIVAYGLFMLLALSADWAEMYQKSFIYNYLSFTILEFAGLAIVQIAIIVVVVTRSIKEEQDIRDIINSGEHEQLEFKTSLRWDVKRDQVNKELERGVMKTVTAFLNSAGGSLVIGVDDHNQVYGLESDLASLTKQNHDGFENHFNNLFVSMIGPEFRQYVRISFHYINNKSVGLVQVDQAHRPAYLKTEKGEDFFIRTGNATTSLKVSQVASYISSQWR